MTENTTSQVSRRADGCELTSDRDDKTAGSWSEAFVKLVSW
jgi:hypothetical protein